MSIKDAIRAGVAERGKQENQLAAQPEDQQAIIPENQKASSEDPVNLSVKVSKKQRLHWLIAAKKEGTTLTAAIIEALNARFGEAAKED